MKNILLTLFALILLTASAAAQTARTVSGSVIDSTGLTIPGVTVKLKAGQDSLLTSTDAEGKFRFGSVKAPSFKLTFSAIGYDVQSQTYTPKDNKDVATGAIKLKTAYNVLGIVNITALKQPIVIKEDTVQYNADAYKVRDGSSTEDLLKKLPAIDVDKDGNIVAHGKPVTKIRVNGKDFFSGDPKLATQNLPADIVQNIQVIDDYGDQAKLTGIKGGEPEKIINITIKKDKNYGQFGRINAGGGTESRFNTRVFANRFNGEQKVSVLGDFNNTDGNQNGSNTHRSGQITYSDEWGKKWKFDTRYGIDDNDRKTTSSSEREEYYQTGNIFRNNQSVNTNANTNHNAGFNLEFKPDTLNFFKISPNFSVNSSSNDNKLDFINTRNDTANVGQQYNNGHSRSPNYGGNFLFNHRFHKRGRNFSINLNFNSSDNTNESQDLYNALNQQTKLRDTIYQQINTSGGTKRYSANVSYTEPLAQTLFLEANYNYSRNNNMNDRLNYRIDPYTDDLTYVDSLSTAYDYQFINHRFGLNLRSIKEKYNFTLGMGIQPSTLQGEFQGTETKRNMVNYIPNAHFVYKFTTNRTLTFNYSGYNQQPSFAQLQPKPDLSNPQNQVYGNPNLKPEFNNRFSLRYNQFDLQSGNTLFVNVDYNNTQNNIVSNTRPTTGTSKGRFVQETRFLNTDGFYEMLGNYAFTTKPFTNKSFTVALNGGLNYNHRITFIENNRNLVRNTMFNQGIKFRADIDSVMDTEISARYELNSAKNSFVANGPLGRNTQRWRVALDGRNYFFDDLILGYNFAKEFNSGFGNQSVNPVILSTYVEWEFIDHKAGSLRFQAFDLLNQNTGIDQYRNENAAGVTRTNRIGRYFLLTVSYRFRKFGGRSMGSGGNGRRGGFGGGGGGGRRGQ